MSIQKHRLAGYWDETMENNASFRIAGKIPSWGEKRCLPPLPSVPTENRLMISPSYILGNGDFIELTDRVVGKGSLTEVCLLTSKG